MDNIRASETHVKHLSPYTNDEGGKKKKRKRVLFPPPHPPRFTFVCVCVCALDSGVDFERKQRLTSHC